MNWGNWFDAAMFVFYSFVVGFGGWVLAKVQQPRVKKEAYKQGMLDANEGWKDAIIKDEMTRCKAVPLEPPGVRIVK